MSNNLFSEIEIVRSEEEEAQVLSIIDEELQKDKGEALNNKTV